MIRYTMHELWLLTVVLFFLKGKVLQVYAIKFRSQGLKYFNFNDLRGTQRPNPTFSYMCNITTDSIYAYFTYAIYILCNFINLFC